MVDNFAFATDYIQTDPWPIARHVLVIAEIGINHNGGLHDRQSSSLTSAKKAGCDAVKFRKELLRSCIPKKCWTPRERVLGGPRGRTENGARVREGGV